MKRRTLLAASALGLTGLGFALKPSDRGQAYNRYFEQLNQELKAQSSAIPTLLVDLDALDDNTRAVKSLLNPSVAFRLVVKSLPSVALLQYLMSSMNTQRLMVFHQPFINLISKSLPDADLLVGKPMPVRSAAQFYQDLKASSAFDPTTQLQWLIDDQKRLEEYLSLAKSLNTKLRINLELDVGLHRGGLTDISEFDAIMAKIQANPNHLAFSGFMGYDPQTAKAPAPFSSPEKAYAASQAQYSAFIKRAANYTNVESLCLNGAGSPSLKLHQSKTVCNELSAGSCFVKPTDFDIQTLDNLKPASYIATPVIKQSDQLAIPFLESMGQTMQAWDPNQQQTYFIYGGYWKAKPWSPAGLQTNELFGLSSNQQMLNGSAKTNLMPNDYVFLRPTQSEAVFLQFGGIQTLRNNQLADKWPVFNPLL